MNKEYSILRSLGVSATAIWLFTLIGVTQAVPVPPSFAWTFDGAGATELPEFGALNANLENGASRGDDVPINYPGNKSLQLNGSDQFVRIDNPNLLSELSTFTYSVWAKPTATDSNLLSVTEQGSIFAFIPASNGVSFSTNEGVQNAETADNLVPLDRWTHVAVVKDGSNNMIYINGAMEASVSNNANLPVLTGNVQIGKFTTFNEFDFEGRLDEAAFWDVALTDSDIRFLSQNTITAIPEPSGAVLGVGFLSLLAWRRDRCQNIHRDST